MFLILFNVLFIFSPYVLHEKSIRPLIKITHLQQNFYLSSRLLAWHEVTWVRNKWLFKESINLKLMKFLRNSYM